MFKILKIFRNEPILCKSLKHANGIFAKETPLTCHFSDIAKKKAPRRNPYLAKALQKLLNIPTVEARTIARNKKFDALNPATLKENYTTCLQAGIVHPVLLDNPEILADTDLEKKITEVKKLPHSIAVTAPLLLLDIDKLSQFILYEEQEGRISIMSELMKVKCYEVCRWLGEKPFLTTLDLSHIKETVQLLTDFGISPHDIKKDMWVLKYRTSHIKPRLMLAKQNNIEVLKTWMVRTQPAVYERHIRRQSDNKLILGDNSIVQYLSEKLECTEEIARYMISKQTALQNKSLKKLNEMIDFLHLNGFKNIQICRTPKILMHSMETISKRLKEMQALKIQLDSLHVLTKSQKQFVQFLDNLKAIKQKKIKEQAVNN